MTSPVPGATSAKATAADTAIADKLREMMAAGKFDRILGGKKERAPVEAFYSGREFAPLWVADGGDERARQERRRNSSPASMPTVSIPPIIRCRRSRPARTPTRWPKRR